MKSTFKASPSTSSLSLPRPASLGVERSLSPAASPASLRPAICDLRSSGTQPSALKTQQQSKHPTSQPNGDEAVPAPECQNSAEIVSGSVPSTVPDVSTYPRIHYPPGGHASEATSTVTDRLRLFIDLPTLRQIDTRRTTAFLRRFASELAAAGLSLPAAAADQMDDDYFNRWVALLSHPSLPATITDTLISIENATLPENDRLFREALARRLSKISLPRLRLDQSLELWFHATEELEQFKSSSPSATLSPTSSAPLRSEICGLRSPPAVHSSPSDFNVESLKLEVERSPSSGASSFSTQNQVSSIGSDIPGNPCSSAVTNSVSPLQSAICHLPSPADNSSAAPTGAHSSPLVVSPAPTSVDVRSPAVENSTPMSDNQRSSAVQNVSTYPLIHVSTLLNQLTSILRRCVVLPAHAAETLALWVLHTYCFHLRDVSTYIGIESPDKGCGKTTLLRVLGKLVRKPVSTANVSPSALFRVIEELQPTLLIDEGDTFLRNNDELRGILNAGYTPDTAFVLRASNESTSSPSETLPDAPKLPSEGGFQPPRSAISNSRPGAAGAFQDVSTYQPIHLSTKNSVPGIRRFSTWCPKAIATIGQLPETLADRCIIIRMQKKSIGEQCERVRHLDAGDLPARCKQFAIDYADAIRNARPQIPPQLTDRAADIWEPLLVLAELAGPRWAECGRQAATALTNSTHALNPLTALLSDLQSIFEQEKTDRLWTRTAAKALNRLGDRPWRELLRGNKMTEASLSQRLRPFGIISRTIRLGSLQAKGYYLEDCQEAFARYIQPPSA